MAARVQPHAVLGEHRGAHAPAAQLGMGGGAGGGPDLHAMLARRPWLVPAFGAYLLHGSGKARFDDRTPALYERAGFAPRRRRRAGRGSVHLRPATPCRPPPP
ncbi:hypothetical protein ACFV4P_30710, partial [Kitasatospora sp. NPDC059795]